jgi:protein SCO1/2
VRCRIRIVFALSLGLAAATVSCRPGPNALPQTASTTNLQTFAVTGVVQSVKDSRTVVIAHDEIPQYMEAMTMPFRVRDTNELSTIQSGDKVLFRLLVTDEKSWIDRLTKTGRASAPITNDAPPTTNQPPREFDIGRIPDFALTNEFGQPLSLRQFRGNALALTFFFTRCPIPEYCPRLSKNFAEASRRLKAMTNGPANWHFLSISFDPFDTPPVLRRYAQTYQYDSNHWSFVTGRTNDIHQLTRGFGVSVAPGAGIFNHGFLTAVFDASGKLQRMWPVGGDTTDMLVREIVQGAGTNRINTAP